MKKRILSLVLALSMMISLFPVSALAQTPGGGTAEMAEDGTTYDGPLEIDNDPASKRYGKPVADPSKWFDESWEDTYNYGYKGDGWVYYSWYDRLVLEKGTWDFNYAKPADSSGDRLAEVKCNVTVGKNAVVTNGNFAGYVDNAGTVKDGTYKNPVINLGTIADGVFDSTVRNTGGRLGAHGLANLDKSSENTYGTISGGLFTGGKSGVNWVYNNDQATITGGVFLSSISYDSGHTRGTITGSVFNNYASGAADGTDFQIRAYNNKGSQYSSSDGKIEIKTAEISDYVNVGSAAWVVLTKNADGAVINPVQITAKLFDKDGKLVEITNINGKPVGKENCDSSYVGGDKKTVQLTMPASDVKLNKPFNLKVIGGNIRVDWNLYNATEAQIPEKTAVTVIASSLVEEPFKEWPVAEGTTRPTGFADGYSLTTNPTKFTMPAGDVTLSAEYYSTTLNMKLDGTPDISNAQSRAEEMSTVYYGKNWEYTEGLNGTPGTLTLTGGTWDFTHYNPANTNTTSFNKAVACYVVINGATVSGGTFANDVWNNGTISGGIFEKTVSNTTGTITGGVFVNKPTGEGTISAGYTLKVDTSSAPNGMLTFVKDGYYDSLKTEIPSAYVVPSNTYKPVISVAGKDVNGDEIRPDNWSVTVNNDPQIKLSRWKGAMLLGGTYTLNPGKVENGATVTLHKTKDVYALTVDGGTITSTTGTIGENAKSGSFEKDTVVTVTAAAPESGKYFAGWTASDDVTLKGADDKEINLTDKTLTFQMPTSNVTLTATYEAYETSLVIVDGEPVTTNREPVYEDGKVVGCKGDGWTYINDTLTLSGAFAFAADANTRIDCSVVVGSGAKLSNAAVVGSNATVTNNGTITNCCFGNPSVTVINNGEISNSIFVKKPGSTGTLSGCLFASNDGLTDCWTVDLNYSDGETAYAGLQKNPFEMSVNEFYVIADASGKLPTIKLSKKANDSLPTQVTVTAPDGAQWTQNISDTDSFYLTIKQPKYTLKLVNAELVDMTGTEFTENTTIKIKPKFDDEEFELDYWTSETTDFDVSSIEDNKDGTYTLKMPGYALTLTANSHKKTYSLTVADGVIGDEHGTETGGKYAKGAQITLTQKVPEGKVFTGWDLSGGLEPVSGYELTNTTIKVTMPGHAATATATYKDKAPTTYTLTVDGGYIGTDENQTSGKFKSKEQVEVTAKAKTGYHFTKWTVKEDTLSLSEEELKANPLTFGMPDGAVSLKANYEEDTPDPVDPNPTPNPDDQPKTYTVTVKGGKINNETEVKAERGTKLTVDVDESEVPEGMTFDVWSIRFPESVKDTLTGDSSVMLHDPHMSFAMPEADITIEAQYRSSELPGEDDGPSTLGTMATVAVGGAAAGILVWQGVSLGVDSYLQLNLPKGVAVPANRRELVVLLWETAGKPEAALPSLYSDVPAEEIELQKATRWAIDSGLVKPADDSDASRFDPDRYVTKYDVFGAWLKLKKLMK